MPFLKILPKKGAFWQYELHKECAIIDTMRKNKNKKILDSEDILLFLKISRRTLFYKIKNENLPCLKVGRALFFKKGQLQK